VGIPCAFVYVTNWTGGLYITGDERIVTEIKDSSGTILKRLQNSNDTGDLHSSKFCLPRLPNKLDLLNSKAVANTRWQDLKFS